MSDYFTKQNREEFGPGPAESVQWMFVDGKDVCFVWAKTYYEAAQKASKMVRVLSNKAYHIQDVIVHGE